ncbi:hypothetical protein [Pseudomonas helleri]|uniref:Uncharacterized protein n=1 Tax=Pseudomonas helleri TaxID=1608996 RepID=A0A6L5I0U3_9PSED|nr:hypothetical protein [Pseudomonas helleri]MQU09256.1 hypothetical protein [Pseudomonas helleri]
MAGQPPEHLTAMTAALHDGQGWPAGIEGLLGAPSDSMVAAARERWGAAQ